MFRFPLVSCPELKHRLGDDGILKPSDSGPGKLFITKTSDILSGNRNDQNDVVIGLRQELTLKLITPLLPLLESVCSDKCGLGLGTPYWARCQHIWCSGEPGKM